ncbi:MAG: hypothetical protein WC797_00460 [Candidatus Paceibacterota bacterium]|jgi:hypothetical protein
MPEHTKDFPVVSHEGRLFFKIRDGFFVDSFMYQDIVRYNVDSVLVLRGGQVIDRGSLCEVGTHGSFTKLDGLESSFGREIGFEDRDSPGRHFRFHASSLIEGDILRVSFRAPEDMTDDLLLSYRAEQVGAEADKTCRYPYVRGQPIDPVLLAKRGEVYDQADKAFVMPAECFWIRSE